MAADRLLAIYHRLPSACRTWVAGARGRQLAKWRYGRETETLIAEAIEREAWTAARWRSWQEERLAELLTRAAQRVPYYRAHWERRRAAGDRAAVEVLSNWPVLEKDSLRANPLAFVADDCDPRRMFRDGTSGTTGKPLTIWMSQATVRWWYAVFEARCRRWHGVSRQDRWGLVGGQLIVPQTRRKPPFWVWNAALDQLYCSSYHLAPDLVPYYLHAIEEYRLQSLVGYPSSLFALADGARRLGRRIPLRAITTNAEPLFDYQRAAIAEAFCCPVQETYGMSEIVAGASECHAGRMHQWPEVGLVEPLPAVDGGEPEMLATGLMNADMPLIRFRVGDRYTPSTESPACACGRLLPALGCVQGRKDDVLYTADGRPVGRLDPVFKSDLPIREAQILQEALGSICLRVVPAEGFAAATQRSLERRLRDRMGDVRVRWEIVDAIPRGRNGKFRAVINQMTPITPATGSQAVAP